MKWVGLTGGIGTGKSTVSRRLQELDFPLVDADLIARKVVEKESAGLQLVIKTFGTQFLNPQGHLDRRKLGQHIFNNESRKLELEALVLPLIRSEVLRQRRDLEMRGCSLAIYDMPLLFESKAQREFEKIIVVTCSQEQQKQRLRLRQQWSEEEIESRLRNQLPLSLKEDQADFLIRNEKDFIFLEQEIQRLVLWLKQI